MPYETLVIALDKWLITSEYNKIEMFLYLLIQI